MKISILKDEHIVTKKFNNNRILTLEEEITSINQLLQMNSIKEIYLDGYLKINGDLSKTYKLHIDLYADGKDCLILPCFVGDNSEEYYDNYEITNSKFKLIVERTVKNFLISKILSTDNYTNGKYTGNVVTTELQNGYLRSENITFRYKGNFYEFHTGGYNIVENKHYEEISKYDEKLTIENIIHAMDYI